MEELTVKQTLRQHLDLRDTSKWAGKKRPKNWAQDAPEVDWYAKLMDVAHDTLKPTHKQAATWERAQEVMIEQYGRKCAKQLMVKAWEQGIGFPEACLELGARLAAKLEPEDLLELLAIYPPEMANEVRSKFHELTGICGDYQDGLDEINLRKPPVD